MSEDFKFPAGLSGRALVAATIIRDTALEGNPNASGGGCRAFYSADEWRARGEDYGRDALLVVVHDGGDLAPMLNLDYCDYARYSELCRRLEDAELYPEQCTSWYSAIYPR